MPLWSHLARRCCLSRPSVVFVANPLSPVAEWRPLGFEIHGRGVILALEKAGRRSRSSSNGKCRIR